MNAKMEIEFYDEEKHDYFLESFREYSREPTEEEKEYFQDVVKNMVEDISDVTGISKDFKLYVAMTKESKLDEDLPINRFVHGYSFAEWMEGLERDVILIRTVKDRENWEDCLANMLAHEMAHQEYYNYCQSPPYTNLENILVEGHAMNRAEQVSREMQLEWRPHYRSSTTPDISSETIIGLLDENRSHNPQSIFQNGERPCENAEGYQIAYLVINDLVNNSTLTLEKVAEKDAEDLRKRVEGSLRKILG